MSGPLHAAPALPSVSPVNAHPDAPVPASGQAAPGRTPPSRHPLQPVFEAGTLHARCAQVLHSVERGLSAHFVLKRDPLAALAQRVAERMVPQRTAGAAAAVSQSHLSASARQAFPWPELQSGGVDRLADLEMRLAGKSAEDQLCARLDLALVTVLLGTDVGPLWRCSEARVLPTAAFVHAPADDLLALLDGAAPKPVLARGQTSGAAALESSTETSAETKAETSPEAGARAAIVEPAADAAPETAAESVSAKAAEIVPSAPPATALLAGAEGLAVAVYRAFVAGAFSANRLDPCRVDASALRHVDVAAVRAILQGTPTNPVPALEGRARLLAQLGAVLQDLVRSAPGGAAGAPSARACSLLQGLPGLPSFQGAPANTHAGINAPMLFTLLVRRLAPAWQAGSTVQCLPAGDVWPHLWAGDAWAGDAWAGDAWAAEGGVAANPHADEPANTGVATAPAPAHDRSTGGWAPLHAQGLKVVAALQAPLQQAGYTLQGLQALPVSTCRTTSALMLRAGVLVPRHNSLLQRSLMPSHDAVVECRAATLSLFDELSVLVHAQLAHQQQHQQQSAQGLTSSGSPPQKTPPTMAHLAQVCADVLRDAPALQLKIEGDGALF